MADLADLDLHGQAAALAAGEVSSVELVTTALERAERYAAWGAFVTMTPELALTEARAADQARARGEQVGPWHGVPTAIKDLNVTAGVRTTFGSAAYADFVPDVSDEVVLRLQRAGLVSIGKTSTPEFGSPCYTEPEGLPAAVTPWDPTRMAGGSSGGAGTAVAARIVAAAQGSDGGGSIRTPASCCGLVGLKPSRGRISGSPAYGDPIGLGTPGALTRTVADAAAMLDVLAGPAIGDPFWAAPPAEPFVDLARREPGRLRVARFSTPLIAETEVHPECLAAYDEASALLADLGHEVVDVPPPLPTEAVADFETCWAVLTALSPVPPGREDDIRPLTRWLSERGRAVSGPEFGLAIGALRRHAAVTLRLLAPFDLVLTPTLADVPLPVGALRDDADPAADFAAQKRFTPWTSAWNVTGMPAISLPLHETPDGLPVGVMLAARPGEEGVLLAAAAQVEAAAPWVDRKPPALT
ncbi:amidase [Nocardioides massiliensis]|uniref:Amidase n=1 Tax=Nocardioides massiliensis TaxID=1325935 RepID=A0ABT9NQ22_9ACTN|nr:amidase [Nocardioides massiliensis]MDP9822532.1 amidase [Nocardioides massiliensis]